MAAGNVIHPGRTESFSHYFFTFVRGITPEEPSLLEVPDLQPCKVHAGPGYDVAIYSGDDLVLPIEGGEPDKQIMQIAQSLNEYMAQRVIVQDTRVVYEKDFTSLFL